MSELPLNKESYVQSNISRASLFSIMTSESHSGDLNAILSQFNCIVDNKYFKTFKNNGFNMIKDKMKLVTSDDGEFVKLFSDKYTNSKYVCYYIDTEIKSEIELSLKIDYLQDANSLSCVKLFITQNIEELCNDYNCEADLSLYANRKIVFKNKNHKKEKKLNVQEQNKPVLLTIRFVDNKLFAKYNVAKEIVLDRFVQKKFDTSLKVGIFVETKIMPFFYDFFVSHIQLCCMYDTGIIAPHFESYEKNYSSSLLVYNIPWMFLETNNKLELLNELISKGYYINMGINERYVKDRSNYNKKDHIHANFIYGINLEKENVKLLGFDKHLKFSEISCNDFVMSIKREEYSNMKINLYKYECKSMPNSLNLEIVKYILKSYLLGDNMIALSSDKLLFRPYDAKILFGHKIYYCILRNDYWIKKFLSDIRISYQIYEHNIIMYHFIEFLQKIGVLSYESSNYLMSKYKDIIVLSNIILNIVLKNQVSKIKDIKIVIRKKIANLLQEERETIDILIDILNDVI